MDPGSGGCQGAEQGSWETGCQDRKTSPGTERTGQY